MIILSFDVGIKNLAYCIIDNDKYILDWNIIDCSVGKNENVIYKLINELDNLPHLLDSDIILIEKQPSFNPIMRIIGTALFVYFTLRICNELGRSKIKILNYSAKYKLHLCNETESLKKNNNIKNKKKKYYNNKKAAIEHTTFLLGEEQNKEYYNYFQKSKKKDDLADCYLQALSYCIKK